MNIKIKYGAKDLERDFGPLTFGELLESRRDDCELSQKDMARKLKISPQRLNDFEKGRRLPDIENAAKFAKVLKDSEAFFIQILFQDYLRKGKIKLEVRVGKNLAA